MNPQFFQFASTVKNRWKYRLFLLTRLPLAFIAGLKLQQLTADKSEIGVRFSWMTKNPFRSIYFAVLSMAAELSTGILCFGQIYQRQPSISMLVSKVEGHFYKKAIGEIRFICEDGAAIAQAVQQAIDTGEPITIVCKSNGYNAQQELVATFYFTWSFKSRSTL